MSLANVANLVNLVSPWLLYETAIVIETASPGQDPTEGAQVRMVEIEEIDE